MERTRVKWWNYSIVFAFMVGAGGVGCGEGVAAGAEQGPNSGQVPVVGGGDPTTTTSTPGAEGTTGVGSTSTQGDPGSSSTTSSSAPPTLASDQGAAGAAAPSMVDSTQPSQPSNSSATGVGFPRTDPVDVALSGPYATATYTMTDAAWSGADVYYPVGAPEPFAAVAVAPGFTEVASQMSWYGELLASHGFVVLITTATNTFADQPPDRGDDLEVAVTRLQAENSVAGSPLEGKLATDRIAVSGHSMGGGGSLYAASALGAQVRAAVPLMEHGPFISDAQLAAITAPTLFIAGELDAEPLGPPDKYSIPHYNALSPGVERAVAVIAGGDHFMAVNGGGHQDVLARYAIAWLKLHLEDDTRYGTYLYGADHMTNAFSTYETAP